jgi:hypothetical protein
LAGTLSFLTLHQRPIHIVRTESSEEKMYSAENVQLDARSILLILKMKI